MTDCVSWEAIQDARRRLEGAAVVTPLLNNVFLDEVTGRQVFVKAESLQIGGSFKFRGAYNRICRLSEQDRAAGVIAWSSGNHAQGVAAAARQAGVRARIVMPEDAPKVKLAGTRALGAEVVTYDRYRESREEIGHALAQRHGGVIIPPFDDPFVIAGQGTCGAEIFDQSAHRGAALDALLVCCGGGGLTAGCALAGERLSPGTHVYAVEPEGYDDHARSLRSGQRERADTGRRSLCDALLSPQPGELTFPINKRLLKGALVVTEAEVEAAVRYAFAVLKLVVEPGGAVALAVLLSGRLDNSYRRIGVVLSGGNVDPDLFARILRGA